ncbi:MAG: sporulation protein YunB [Clostridiales bacterium]|nr:sporulation protein YunB [Clostridiales bacterium]
MRRPRPRPPRRGRGKGRGLILLGAALLTAAVLLWVVDGRIRPIVLELARAELDNLVTAEVNEVCSSLTEAGELSYNDLVQVFYDDSGEVVGMTTDMDMLNALRVSMGREVSTVLDGMERQRVQIPIGAVLNLTVFSSLGPEVSVEILHAGQVGISFESEFQSAGINQTLHQINMVISVDVLLMIPGGVHRQQLTSTIPLAQSILMGDVPESYASWNPYDQAADSNAAEEQ